MLDQILNKLGLSQKEQAIYKLILERDKISATDISLHTDINRTTVYSVVSDLIKKGLIMHDIGGKVAYYLPVRENELERVIKEEKNKIEQKEKVIRDLQEVLKTMPHSNTYSVPKIRFIDEIDMESYLYEAFPRWEKDIMKISDQTIWGYQDHTFAENYEEWIDWAMKRTDKNFKVHLLSNKSEIEVQLGEKEWSDRRIVKPYLNGFFTVSNWVLGDYVVYIMTKNKPFYIVEIYDSVIAHNTRELFKSIWN